MQAGKIYDLKVVRKTDLGYMVSNGEEEILLHYNDMKEEPKIDDVVKAFIYYDKKGRLCATTKDVDVTIDKPGFASVVETISNLGVFVSINTGKDILISKDYLPYDKNKWPNVSDKVLIRLKVKKDSLVAKPLNSYEIEELKSNVTYELNSMVEAYVIRVGEAGINLVTNELVNVFVHRTHLRRDYRVGETVVVKIIHLGERGYNGSLIENKEKMIDPDKELIMQFLNGNSGKLHLDAKSSSEEIEAILHISRKAFKRALGGLYKEKLVYFEDGYTYIANKKSTF